MTSASGVRLRYLGHSAVQLKTAGCEILIDPFISENPLAAVGTGDLKPDYIVVTHAHGDHWGDTEELASEHEALVISCAEIAVYAGERGLKSHPMNTGGSHAFEFGSVRFTPAFHSSSFDSGRYGGMPMGVVIDLGGVTLYHAGDTALFSDMRLIGRHGLDVALLPIGDNFTMGPDDAIEAVKLLEPRLVIPIHFNTFARIKQDGLQFVERVMAETSARAVCLAPGDIIDL